MFSYYDPSGRAYHGLHFYYFCRPLTIELIDDELVEDGAAEKPRWMAIKDLQPEIPEFRNYNIPIKHEIEFEYRL